MTIHRFNNGELKMQEWIVTVGEDNFIENWSYGGEPLVLNFELTSNREQAITMSETEAQTLIDDIVAHDGRTDLGMQKTGDSNNDGVMDAVVTSIDDTKKYILMDVERNYITSFNGVMVTTTDNYEEAYQYPSEVALKLLADNDVIIGIIEAK